MRMYLCFLVATLSACTTIKVDHQSRASLYRTPETSGKDITDLHATLGAGQKVVLATANFDPVFGTGTSLNTALTYEKSSDLYLGGGIGFLDNLDVFGDLALDSPLMVGVQWQFMGDSASIRSPGLKASALVSLGYHTETDHSSSVTSCTSGSSNCTTAEKMDAEHKVFENTLGISVGQRMNESFLLYFSPLYSTEYTWGTLTRQSNSLTYSFKSRSVQYAANLGAEFNFGKPKEQKCSYLRTEYSISRISSETGYGNTANGISLSIGFKF